MKVFTVKEVIARTSECYGEGIYSSLAEAQKAILERVAEDYSKQEMKGFKFTFDGYEYKTLGNDWAVPRDYYIKEVELNASIA